MNNTRKFLTLAALVALAIAGSTGRAKAQDVILGFDDSSFTNGLWKWWGGAAATWTWDGTQDSSNNVASGSIRFDYNYAGSGDNQLSVGMSLSGLGAYEGSVTLSTVDYDYFEMDVKWDTNSTFPVDTFMANGDPQGLGMGLATPGWGQTWIPYASNPHLVGTNGEWEHFTVPINNSWPNFPGLIFKHWFPANAPYSGTVGFWIDNIKFHFSGAPPPDPTMSMKFAKKGLNLTAIIPGGQYQREGVRSTTSDSTIFVGSTDPVTYSLTVAEAPDPAAYGGFQTHLFLAPDGTGNGPDYSAPNAIMLDIRAAAGNTGTATFRYKTNNPNGNTMMYVVGQGQLGTLTAPSVVGEWSVTFANDTNVTLNGPGGSSLNLVLPPDSAALFTSPTPSMNTIIGVQPNQPGNVGQSSTISHYKLTVGATTVTEDDFSVNFPGVDPAKWVPALDGGANALELVDSLPAGWVSWSLPDPHTAGLFVSTNFPDHYDPYLPSVVNGGTRRVFFNSANFPAGNQAYFWVYRTDGP